MNRMPIIIDIDGSEAQIYEKMYDYVCNANFSLYAPEVVDASDYAEHDAESMLPKVLVRKINLYEDVNFLQGRHQQSRKMKTAVSFLKQWISAVSCGHHHKNQRD